VFASLLRDNPFVLTAGGILVGIALITRYLPFTVIGVVLVLVGLLVPFIRATVASDRPRESLEIPAAQSS
jgi:hypothetical protein